MAARETLNGRGGKPLVVLIPDAVDWVLGTWAREIAAINETEFDFAVFPFGEISRRPEHFARIVEEADVVHCLTQSSFSAVAAAIGGRGAAAPALVASIHHIVEIGDVEACLAADRISVMCEEARAALLESGVPPERLFLLRKGVDTRHFRPHDRSEARVHLGIPRGVFTLGFSAKATSDDRGRKGIDVLLEVLTRIPTPTRAPVRVALTGPGWERMLATAMPSDIEFDYFPFLAAESMPEFYSALDVYLSVARTEGGPLPVLEAMSCGTPVVSTRVGTVRDLVADGVEALLVPTDDVAATVVAVESLRNDPERAARIGSAGRACIVRKLDCGDAARRARELYAPLIRDSHGTGRRRIGSEDLARMNARLARSDSNGWARRCAEPEPPVDEVAHVDLAQLGVDGSSRILDLGCGNGQLSIPLLERKLAVVSVDLDAPRLREVRDACSEEDLPARTVRADAARLPWVGGSFDAVVCREMLEHVPEPGIVLDEIRRVLRPGGRLCVTVPSAHTERIYQWIDSRWLEMCGHVHVFSRRAMRDLLAAHGFRVTEVRGRNFFYAFFWLVHTFVRTTHDGTGRIQNHFGLARLVFRVWRWLGEGRSKRAIERVGNALLPKSNVYYCIAPDPDRSE